MIKPILFLFVLARVAFAVIPTKDDVSHYSYTLLAIHDAEESAFHFESASLRGRVFQTELHRLTQEIAPRSELISLVDHVDRQPDRKHVEQVSVSPLPFLQLGHAEELYTMTVSIPVLASLAQGGFSIRASNMQGYRIKVGGRMGSLLERMAVGGSNFFLLSHDSQKKQKQGLTDRSTKAWRERFSQASPFHLHRLSFQLVFSMPRSPSPPLKPYSTIPNLKNYHQGRSKCDFRRLLYTIHSAALSSTRPTDEAGLQSIYSVFFPKCRVLEVFYPQHLFHFIESPFNTQADKVNVGLMVPMPQNSTLKSLPQPPQLFRIPSNAFLLETPDSLSRSSPQHMVEGLDVLHFVYIEFNRAARPVRDLQKHQQLLERLNSRLADG